MMFYKVQNMLKRSRSRKFNWQINASAVGKLLGYFGPDRAVEALAQTWRMNLKRMPRFGVTPSVQPGRQTTEEIAEAVAQAPAFKEMVKQGIDNPESQAQVAATIKREAVRQAKAASAAEVRATERLHKMTPMRHYSTKKAGVGRAAINSYFTVGDKVYHKTSSKHATLSTAEEAETRGYVFPEKRSEQVHEVAKAKETSQRTQKVAAVMQKTATKVMNTTRGQQKELTDLERVRLRYPHVVAGNDRAYFLNVTGGGFVIGRIDGRDTETGAVFELKHRQSRLFREFRRYEQAQCMVYMKMLRTRNLTLVETFRGEQCDHQMREQDGQFYIRTEDGKWNSTLSWHDLRSGLEGVVCQLKKAEEDADFRQTLIDILY